LWSNGWMDQDTTWYVGMPGPGSRCVRWGPAPLPLPRQKRGTAASLTFQPMSIVAKWLDGSGYHLVQR